MIDKKCFICKRPAVEKFSITIDDGGKLHANLEEEETFICSLHLKEFEHLKRKRRQKVDFH